MPSLNKKELREANYNAFKRALDKAEPSYNSLSTLRAWFYRQDDQSALVDKKIRHIQNRMKKMAESGERVQKRRVPGTGEKVETEKVYTDTPENRKLNRVGQTYKVTRYVNAEYVDYQQKSFRRLNLNKRKRKDEGEDGEPKKKKRESVWIQASRMAKEEMNTPSMIKLRKQITDPESEQQQYEHKVYLRAMEIMRELQAQREKEKAEQAAAAQEEEETSMACDEDSKQEE